MRDKAKISRTVKLCEIGLMMIGAADGAFLSDVRLEPDVAPPALSEIPIVDMDTYRSGRSFCG